MSRLAHGCRGVAEAAWLAALVVSPLYFNIQSQRVFEPDKAMLIRWLAVMAALAWIVWAVDSGWRPSGRGARSLIRALGEHPFLAPTLLVVVSYLVSTLLSIAPRTSVFGSYQRGQGLWSTCSYVVLFFVLYHFLRSPRQVERLVTVTVATSVPVALYAIVQHFGGDPIPWGGDVQTRPPAHLGNPIFLGAYLILPFFLTLYRVWRVFARLTRANTEPVPLTEALAGGAYVFVALLQAIALFLSQSRGPFLGWAVGLYLFGLLALLALRPRGYRPAVAAWVGTAVAGAVFLVVFNLPNSPLAGLRTLPYVGRLGQILDTSVQNPTGRVRVLIWEGAVRLILPHEPLQFPPDMHPDPWNALRPLVGYGPETMWVAYPRFYPPELAQVERKNASPDRSHNEVFDALIRTGVLGFVAFFWLFTSIFYFALRWVGLIRDRRDARLFLAAWFGAGLAAVLLARWLDGTWRFFGVALPFGCIVGLVAYTTVIGMLRSLPPVPPAARPRFLLLLALLAAVAAHYVELVFGIAIVSTRTYFWVFTALIAAVGTGRVPLTLDEGEPVPPKRHTRRVSRPSDSESARVDREVLGYALVVFLIFATLAYELVTNFPVAGYMTTETGRVLAQSLFTKVVGGARVANTAQFHMLLITWLVLALVGPGGSAQAGGSARWLRGIGWTTLAAWAGFGIMAWRQARFLATAGRLQTAAAGPDAVLRFAEHMARFPLAYYVMLLSVVVLLGLVLVWPFPQAVWLRRKVTAGVLVGASLVTVWVGFGPAYRPIQADILFKHALSYAAARRFPEAERLFEAAISRAPQEDSYYLFYGRTLLEHAQFTDDPEERSRLVEEAGKVLLQARDLNPLNPDHTANLARFHVARANMAADSQAKAALLEQAVGYFDQAISLSPHNARLRVEYAVALLDLGRLEAAYAQLQTALRLDETFGSTYLYLGDYYRAKAAWDEALDAYFQALHFAPDDPRVLDRIAYVYLQKGDVEQAVAYYEEAIRRDPRDFLALRDLALLYWRQGDLEKALEYARQALAVAPPEERPQLDQLVRELQDTEKKGPP